MIGTLNPQVLKGFYKEVFQKDPEMDDGEGFGWVVGNCFFGVGKHDEVGESAQDPKRIILNFETPEVEEEFNRIKEVEGVKVIKEPYDMEGTPIKIATLADPDGNYFQLMSPWEEQPS